MKKKQYTGLDIGKFICAILVIAIHTQPFIFNVWLDRGAGIITRIAVPFFFMTTGFLVSDYINDISKYIIHIAILYLIWSLIYYPLNQPFTHIIQSIFVTGTCDHLWYLPALIFSIAIIALLKKHFRTNSVLMISFVFYIIGTLFSTYENIITIVLGKNFISSLSFLSDFFGYRNGLFYGFFFVSFGCWIHEIKRISKQTSFFLFCFGLFLLTIESAFAVLVLHTSSTVLWISSPIAVGGLFTFLKEIEIDKDTRTIRKMSSFIYFSHYLWIILLHRIGVNQGLFLFLTTVLLCLVSSYCFVILSGKYRVINYLL